MTSVSASTPAPGTPAAADAPVRLDTWETGIDGRLIGVLRLNRPRQLNALNLAMCEAMRDALQAWASDERIVAVVLEGEGEKGLCAGGDVAEVVRRVRAGGPTRYAYADAFFAVEYQLDRMLHEYRKPLIALVHGVCMGGGLGLVAGASHRVVAEDARIAMPEIHIGLFPDVGGGFFLNRVPGGIGRVLALTGLSMNPADALFAGLADHFVPREAWDDLRLRLRALDWTGAADEDRHRVSRLLLGFSRRFHPGLPESLLRMYFEALRFVAMQPEPGSMLEALRAAAADDPWFEPMARALGEGSPTGACVSLEYLRRCARRSLPEVLEIDRVLAHAFVRRHDFVEGVRALLIDKDRTPKWSPSTLEAVDPAEVDGHFAWPADRSV